MNDQRQVIFSQRLKMLNEGNIKNILDDFFEEQSKFLLNAKDTFNKSKDQKPYLTSLKNIVGNSFGDEKLIDLAELTEDKFLNQIKEKYNFTRKEREQLIGNLQNDDLEKKIFIQVLDFNWRSHLQYLEQLRQVIGLRSYGQKDPLSEFKKEAFALFEVLLDRIKIDVIKFLFNLKIVLSENKPDQNQSKEFSNQKVGRNEKCPCGSGKKFKHCCGNI